MSRGHGGGNGGSSDPAVAESVRRLSEQSQLAQRWGDHLKAFDAALALAGGSAHDLAGAGAALDKLGDDGLADEDLAAARAGLRALTEGFERAFQELDANAAKEAFAEAARRFPPDSPLGKYAAAARTRLAAMQQAVGTEMEPVSAGRVRLAGAASTLDVDAFYVDRCETSVGEFSAFLDKVKTERARYEPKFAALPGLEGADAATVDRRLLAMPPCYGSATHDPRLPIEQASYAQALLCLQLESKSLPRFEEWWLATKGSLTRLPDHRRFPWSVSANAKLSQLPRTDALSFARRQPMRVDEGGVAIEFVDASVHHLSGNVEEWTLAEPVEGSTRLEARVVGGAYTDGTEQEDYFAGVRIRVEDARKTPERRVGFRGVLRPRDFFAASGLAPKL